MNTPNPALTAKTDATRAVLRPCKQPPRPIPYPKTGATAPIGGER